MPQRSPEKASHQRYLHYMISGLKPPWPRLSARDLTGDIHFDYPDALAEIVLLVLTVKLDGTPGPSTRKRRNTIRALVALKGYGDPAGSLGFSDIRRGLYEQTGCSDLDGTF